MKNILVAIDFEDNLSVLLDKALEIAQAFQAKLWLVHITAPEPDFVGYDVGPQYIRDSRAEELRAEHRWLQKYSAELKSKGVTADGLLIQGATIEMLMEESKKLNADLIIAGHHKHGFLYKSFVGSVSSGIIKESKIPVMLIPLE